MGSPHSKPLQRIMAEIVALSWPDDGAAVLDLCRRAADYVRLEKGADPDMDYVQVEMTDAPQNVQPEHLWCWGYQHTDGQIDGIATCLKGFYRKQDWYLGLLLMAPTARGNGLGAQLAHHVIAQARSDAADCLRVAVLDTNPRARVFWERLGFAHEKSTSQGDGQMRHVHRLPLRGNTHDL